MRERPDSPDRAAATGTSGGREPAQRWRIVVRRDVLPAEVAQRDQLAAWDAALVATGLPLVGLDLPKPRPRLAIAAPLASDVVGEAELVDIWLVARLPRWQVRAALAASLPPGHDLVDVYDVWLGEPALPGRVAASVYRATLGAPVDPAALEAAATELLAAEALPRDRRKGEATVRYDLRPFLLAIEVEQAPDGAPVVRMTLRHDPERGIGRPEETLAALGESLGAGPLVPRTLARERLVLAEAPAAEPPAPRGPRRGSGGRQPGSDRLPAAGSGRR